MTLPTTPILLASDPRTGLAPILRALGLVVVGQVPQTAGAAAGQTAHRVVTGVPGPAVDRTLGVMAHPGRRTSGSIGITSRDRGSHTSNSIRGDPHSPSSDLSVCHHRVMVGDSLDLAHLRPVMDKEIGGHKAPDRHDHRDVASADALDVIQTSMTEPLEVGVWFVVRRVVILPFTHGRSQHKVRVTSPRLCHLEVLRPTLPRETPRGARGMANGPRRRTTTALSPSRLRPTGPLCPVPLASCFVSPFYPV